ncbi:MAG: heme ABC transporter ATP-binding protein [Thalassobius sp.]|nr:heme ABC transporter ATP-binding protein [Thalassovita sp.]
MFTIDNISKSIGRKTILRNCSLQIEPGKFTAVVGPNGAGKTTLLKILSGETKKFAGEVKLNGKNISNFKNHELSKLRAILPQHTVVNFPFTIEQVIEIGRYAFKDSSAAKEEVIDKAIALTGLEKYKGRHYQTLSGGEKQRVQMARVIAQLLHNSPDPKYLLLDEPTSSLDLAQQHALLALAKKQCNRHIGVLAILHDLNLAIQYADDILFLKEGQTVAYGACNEVATTDVIEETFSHPVKLIEDNGQLIIVPKSILNIQTKNLNTISYGQFS